MAVLARPVETVLEALDKAIAACLRDRFAADVSCLLHRRFLTASPEQLRGLFAAIPALSAAGGTPAQDSSAVAALQRLLFGADGIITEFLATIEKSGKKFQSLELVFESASSERCVY